MYTHNLCAQRDRASGGTEHRAELSSTLVHFAFLMTLPGSRKRALINLVYNSPGRFRVAAGTPYQPANPCSLRIVFWGSGENRDCSRTGRGASGDGNHSCLLVKPDESTARLNSSKAPQPTAGFRRSTDKKGYRSWQLTRE